MSIAGKAAFAAAAGGPPSGQGGRSAAAGARAPGPGRAFARAALNDGPGGDGDDRGRDRADPGLRLRQRGFVEVPQDDRAALGNQAPRDVESKP